MGVRLLCPPTPEVKKQSIPQVVVCAVLNNYRSGEDFGFSTEPQYKNTKRCYLDAMSLRRDILNDSAAAAACRRDVLNMTGDRSDDPYSLHLVLYIVDKVPLPREGEDLQWLVANVPVGTIRIVSHVDGFPRHPMCPHTAWLSDTEKPVTYNNGEPLPREAKWFSIDKLAVLQRYAKRAGGWAEKELIQAAITTLQTWRNFDPSDLGQDTCLDVFFFALNKPYRLLSVNYAATPHPELLRQNARFDEINKEPWRGRVIAPGAGATPGDERVEWEACGFSLLLAPKEAGFENQVVGMYLREPLTYNREPPHTAPPDRRTLRNDILRMDDK